MTEINKNIVEMTHTEASINLSGNGDGYGWQLHALKHYAESDKKLSDEYIENMAKSLNEKEIRDCSIRVTDGYDDEGDNQHYQLELRFGNDKNVILSKKIEMSVDYKAKADDVPEPFNGSIKVTMSLPSDTAEDVCLEMTQKAYKKYNKLVEDNYPDWKTEFKNKPVIKIISI